MKSLRVTLLISISALVLSSCTLISPNATPDYIAKSTVHLGLLNATIPNTNHARVRFITKPVYIVDATGHLAPSSRIVASPPGLSAVIQQLQLGPSAIEKSLGYTSALPKNEVLVSAVVLAKVGYINFAEPLNTLSRNQQLLAIGALVLTAYDVGATNGVVIKVAGVTQRLLLPNGQSATIVTKKDFVGLLNA